MSSELKVKEPQPAIRYQADNGKVCFLLHGYPIAAENFIPAKAGTLAPERRAVVLQSRTNH